MLSGYSSDGFEDDTLTNVDGFHIFKVVYILDYFVGSLGLLFF